jgi:hypothetical protein
MPVGDDVRAADRPQATRLRAARAVTDATAPAPVLLRFPADAGFKAAFPLPPAS